VALATYPEALGEQPCLLLGLAPGEVYLAGIVTYSAGGLLHHRFTLTLAGGLLSVALSLGLPRVGVTHHLALWSPDVPRLCRDRLVPIEVSPRFPFASEDEKLQPERNLNQSRFPNV